MEEKKSKQDLIDLIADSTKETRNALDENISNGVNKFFELLGSTPVSRAISLYIEEAPFKLEEARKKMLEKYNKIPAENIVEPNPRIALNIANEFNYCLDEENIKEMFTNILVSDMDKSKKSKVLPSYIDIVKQLSTEDARFLKTLKELKGKSFALDIVQYKLPNSPGVIPVDKIIVPSINRTIKLNDIVIDNLERTKIIKIYEDRSITDSQLYKIGFDNIKHYYNPPVNIQLTYQAGVLEITNFGQNFIDICLS